MLGQLGGFGLHPADAGGTYLEPFTYGATNALGHNALADIRGRDPDLNHEIILVGANMDGLGVDPEGTVFPGADSNASGVAVLVHLADVLTANRFRPKRRVIFCGFGAKEQGLAGSRALAARYPFLGKIVAVLNVDMVGGGDPVLTVSGVGAYPAMSKRLQGYLPKSLRAATVFRLRSDPAGDHWSFHERGIPSFLFRTQGDHAGVGTPADKVENVKPACLEAAARVVGTLLVRLATDPAPLDDPLGLTRYLAREGPRFALATLTAEGALVAAPHTTTDGTTGYIVTVAATLDPRKSWAALEALEGTEGPTRYRLVRRAADIGRAYRDGRIALLPRLVCRAQSQRDRLRLVKYVALGYRWLAPWAGADAVNLRGLPALLEACKRLPALIDLSGLSSAHWAQARKTLGNRPAVIVTEMQPGQAAVWHAARPALGAETLALHPWPGGIIWQRALTGAAGLPEPVFLSSDRKPQFPELLAVWAEAQPPGWDLPGSPQRQAIRAALGGRLVEWLARSER